MLSPVSRVLFPSDVCAGIVCSHVHCFYFLARAQGPLAVRCVNRAGLLDVKAMDSLGNRELPVSRKAICAVFLTSRGRKVCLYCRAVADAGVLRLVVVYAVMGSPSSLSGTGIEP